MSRKPRLYLALAAVAALMAVIPATSSAAVFKWNNTQAFETKSLSNQVFSFKGGGKTWDLSCTKAAGYGYLKTTDFSEFELTVDYSGCSMWGFPLYSTNGAISKVTYRYHAGGQLDVLTPLVAWYKTILGACTLTIEPQSNLSAVNYTNSEYPDNPDFVYVGHALEGISYSTKGSLCPAESGSGGTLAGLNELKQPGGWVHWDE